MLRRVGLLIVLLALMVLTTGAVQAAPRLAGPKPASESGGVLDRLWGWLSTLLPGAHPSPDGAVKSTWELDGSHLDPNGGEH
jgi:hypothetical protein